LISLLFSSLLKPLSAFIHGFEGFKESLSEATESLVKISLEENRGESLKMLATSISFMKITLNSLVGAYQVLLMKINRFTDYTKFTHGIPLIPTLESIHLYDSIVAPISCVQDLQSRIAVELENIAVEISEYIITDRQWLQDNILCLVYNAVKFSMDGEHSVIIRISLASSSVSASASPSNTKVVRFSELEEVKDLHSDHKDLETGLLAKGSSDPLIGPRMIRIEVEDYGIGISKTIGTSSVSEKADLTDTTKLVFSEPDMTKKRESNVGGNGLGLFCLAKRIVALGGEYGAEEKKGSLGSVFWFTIPYVADHWKIRSVPSFRSSHDSHRRYSSKDSFELKVFDPISNHLNSDKEDPVLAGNDLKGNISNILAIPSILSRPSTSSSVPVIESGATDQPQPLLKSRETSIEEIKSQVTKPSSRDSSFSKRILEPAVTLINSLTKSGGVSEPLVIPTMDPDLSPRKQHVLVVDDSLPIVKMLRIMLEKNGFHVSIASNGLEAVQTVRKLFESQSYSSLLSGKNDAYQYPPFDAILMDIQMPIMDGLEATTKIRELERELISEPENIRSNDVCSSFTHLIVAMSASSDDETINSAYNAGADEFISKPFNIHSFQKTLEEYNQRRRLSKRSNHESLKDYPPLK
jgi:CheY-like chemotaxis protein/signal transduction histidine kinase